MKLGVVDLDTSHPENWVPIERELGHDVVGLWDGGAIHPAGYAEEFARKFEIPKVYESLEAMAGEVDCAIIHGCDWDSHVEKARPFAEKGKAVLVDKPMAGTLRDLRQFCEWARQGVRIAGGSSLRFCHEVQEYLAQPIDERGTPDTVLAGCGTDEFNYGVHAYSLLCGIMGPGIQSVRHLGKGAQHRVQVNWTNGRMGFLIVGQAEGWIRFYASITTGKTNTVFQTDSTRLYRALLAANLPYLSGETDQPPVSMEDLIEPELAALAARQSWMNGDAEVPLASLDVDDEGYDGKAFADQYRKNKYPES